MFCITLSFGFGGRGDSQPKSGVFYYAGKSVSMGEFLGLVFFVYLVFLFLSPPNKNSTSYRLGRGVGNKTRKFGEWLTKDD